MISEVNVTGNKATVILSGEADGAAGYDQSLNTFLPFSSRFQAWQYA